MPNAAPDALLDPGDIARLRVALEGYTAASVTDAIGLTGQAALQRRDICGAVRTLRGRDDPVAVLIRLFVLGASVTGPDARRALHPLPLGAATAAGLVEHGRDGSVRAAVDLRPYGETGTALTGRPGGDEDGADWWIVSDLGSDVRPGPLRPDHVLGVGSASLTLAQAVPRVPVARALDLGTGSGVQALHLAGHAGEVVATDVSSRALRLAATTAALSGQTWTLRQGSLLDPVDGETFDLVVANPPFVVSDGAPGWEYRDSGLAGDAVSERLLRGIPAHLTENGRAHLLVNWIVPGDGDWRDRVGGWLTGAGCDAWVWQREVAEPGEYVALWLRDSGLEPGTAQWARRYDAWLDWFAAHDVAAVGMGLASLWRTDRTGAAVVLEDVPQAVSQPVWPELDAWVHRRRWLDATGDAALLDTSLRAARDVVRDRSDVLGHDGWTSGRHQLRQAGGLRWAVDTDDAILSIVAGCDGTTPLSHPLDLLAAATGHPAGDVRVAALPVVRDLVARGFLLVPGDPTDRR